MEMRCLMDYRCGPCEACLSAFLVVSWYSHNLFTIQNQGCTILSGDVIIRHLAEQLKPEYVVFLVSSPWNISFSCLHCCTHKIVLYSLCKIGSRWLIDWSSVYCPLYLVNVIENKWLLWPFFSPYLGTSCLLINGSSFNFLSLKHAGKLFWVTTWFLRRETK